MSYDSRKSATESDYQTDLLSAIVSEPWFRQPEVPLLTEPVARALTEMMSESANSLESHGEMCRRLLDIKQQLNLREDFELQLVSELISQLERLIDELMKLADEARKLGPSRGERSNNNSSRSSTVRCKGDNLLDLLRQMGHDLTDELRKRWTGALLSATLAEDASRQHRRPRRRRHRGHSDSGMGTESVESTETSESGDSRNREQRRLNALSEEERQTAATSLSQRDLDADGKHDSADEDEEPEALQGLLLRDEASIDETEEADAASTVRFMLPPETSIGSESGNSEEKHWLPPVPTPPPMPRPIQRRPVFFEAKEETVFDQMGDFRLKRLVQNLPPIVRLDLESIAERSRQSASSYRCPRLVDQSSRWSNRSSGYYSDRSQQPDATSYSATWQPAQVFESEPDDSTTSAPFRLPALDGQVRQTGRSQARVRFSSCNHDEASSSGDADSSIPMRPSELWDAHCRMESLAKHGMDAAGIRIGRHLARDRLLFSLLLPSLRE
ncbi:hypothetical protein BOX15_Mlig000440g1 [Macrostomum lignano]|uniref:Uncharacterized protein n=1 Tax=Macrostomum lignano TaxID=282301 RepID=A0A267GYF8_9PLAT|nr:hypothetical protein BOX15_Mlig000440g1 [Macrostomum lignano]